jgi:hypothetical protein
MNNTKHTPGPWKVDRVDDDLCIVGQNNNPVASCFGTSSVIQDTYLIAAAPEMLSALELILNDNRLMNAMSRIQAQAIMDSVAKAKGE